MQIELSLSDSNEHIICEWDEKALADVKDTQGDTRSVLHTCFMRDEQVMARVPHASIDWNAIYAFADEHLHILTQDVDGPVNVQRIPQYRFSDGNIALEGDGRRLLQFSEREKPDNYLITALSHEPDTLRFAQVDPLRFPLQCVVQWMQCAQGFDAASFQKRHGWICFAGECASKNHCE